MKSEVDLGRVPSEPGSHPTGHAACSVDGAPRFDPSRDPTPAPFWLVLTEQNYAIRFSFDNGNYAIDFRIFSACESSYGANETMSWGLFDGNSSHDFGEWERADWEIDGAVKWDGCINWQTNQTCMAHGCGPTYPDDLHAIFCAVYSAGGWFYDYLGDEPPKMPRGVINIRDSDGSASAARPGTGLDPEDDSAGREASPITPISDATPSQANNI
jgi:hypothetical protein